MKIGFYSKLAIGAVKKNKKIYSPYIFTGIGLIMMSFILSFLSNSDKIKMLKGGSNISEMLGLGQYIVAFFSMLFLIYANSFLMKRRKKEFGLYSILGLSKGNISKIIFLENTFMYILSMIGGLFFGMIFSKASELILTKIMHGKVTYNISFTSKPFIFTAILFAVIFFVLLLNSLRQIKLKSPVELLKSESAGEKTPKANWILGMIGILVLASAYFIALYAKSPIEALLWFFVAVILVIIGTYILFITGSVTLCHLLSKNKKYYYQTKHFVSVSQMKFRMKRSGAGLASICILATIVLVMMASSASLYFGAEDSLKARYPYDFETVISFKSHEKLDEEREKAENIQNEYFKNNNINITSKIDIAYSILTGQWQNDDGYVEFDESKIGNLSMKNICTFCFFAADDYMKNTGEKIDLKENEVLVSSYRKLAKSNIKSINFSNHLKLDTVGQAKEFFIPGSAAVNISEACIVIIKDFSVLKPLDNLADSLGDKLLTYDLECGVNTDCPAEKQIDINNTVTNIWTDYHHQNKDGICSLKVTSVESEKDDFYGTFGGIFFLGIILSLIFMFATVMIIYYKQISEGYEDEKRFEIMQKIGMTKKEIKKSINSQMLTVFLAPVIFATLHLAFAFPAIRKILLLFNLTNLSVILITTAISVLAFFIFYAVVYKITLNEYYRIVCSKN